MLIKLRKSYPYYGKFKFKMDLGIYKLRLAREDRVLYHKEVIGYLEQTFNEDDFYWYGDYIYLIDQQSVDRFIDEFGYMVSTLHKPSPGYEQLTGRPVPEERCLWYNRFPFKISLNIGTSHEIYNSIIEWCERHIQYNYRKNCTTCSSSLFFISMLDAGAFKLTFSDYITDSFIPNKEKARMMLQKRVDQAEQDLSDYLDGLDN